ncbi:cilia- and flagella-associated protein 52-like [Melanaphis sacchari]|uniref:cilia- and flagella-associated protein 52-like n=1 Tax=Melanaphis sacchari TaxID=742174 RepID=UPI000DC12DC4|nr:cilia- and flagella-associated protein 52-like [Melanaphis sacchari]XP_025199724.1 cilia- and flagella-associated protein 52-like [Melanaphis sacchari]XP_025199806.1 cilia- and flagella-associated protein 52-like [Melanaphis sacchari]
MDGEIVVQDLELQSLIGFDGNPLNGLILHPDGVHLVYPLGTNITAYNWHTKAQRFFEGHTNVISAVTVSTSGRYVGSGQVNYMGFRSPIIVWCFHTGQVVAKYESHKVRVESVAFSCCENFLISLGGVDDGSVIVYDIDKREVLCGSSSVKSTAGTATVLRPVHTRGECFVVAGDNILRLWTLNREQRNIQGLDGSFAKIKRKILCTVIDRLDEYAYCGTSTGDVMKIKLNFSADTAVVAPTNAPTLVGCFAKHPPAGKNRRGVSATAAVELYSKGITALYLVADGTMLVGSGDGVIELVKQRARDDGRGSGGRSSYSKTGSTRLATPTRPLLVAIKSANVDSSVTSIQLMDDGVVLVGTVDCELFAVRARDFDVTCLFTCHTSVVYDLAFPHDYSKVFATASKHDVRVWSVDTLQELLRITVRNFTCSGVLFSYDGAQIVTSWNDGNIRIFAPETGRLLYAINNCHNKGVSAIAMSKDGRKLLSGGGEGQVRVWQVNNLNGALQAVLKEHKGPVSSIDVHQLGHEAITASADGTCVVWDIVRFTRLSIMFSSTIFTSAKYHPNGAQLLTCGTNRYIGFWEALDGSLIREIEGSSASALNSLDVTPNGKYIVTGSSDQMVKVWLYNEGVPTHVGVGHAGVVTNVKVSPDGKFVVSTSADGGIFLWRFPHVADTAPPGSRCSANSGGGGAGSLREQQTDRSRQLSLKKTLPARKENINVISKAQKVRTDADGSGSSTAATSLKVTGDGNTVEKAVDGSVKCLCRRGSTATCVRCDHGTESWKVKPFAR